MVMHNLLTSAMESSLVLYLQHILPNTVLNLSALEGHAKPMWWAACELSAREVHHVYLYIYRRPGLVQY